MFPRIDTAMKEYLAGQLEVLEEKTEEFRICKR